MAGSLPTIATQSLEQGPAIVSVCFQTIRYSRLTLATHESLNSSIETMI